MSREKRLIKNSVIFAIGNFGSKAITFIMLPYYTYLLTTKQYGEVEIIMSTIALLVPIISVNLFEAAFRFALDKENDNISIFSSALVTNLVLISLVLILYPLFIKLNIGGEYLFISLMLLFISIIELLFKQFSKAIDKINVYMYSDFVQVIVFVIGNIFFIGKCDLGVLGYIISKIIALMSDSLVLFWGAKLYKFIDIRKIDKQHIKDMIKFGVPLIPNSLMWWINNLLDRYIITYMLGLSSVGLYSFAAKFPSILATFNGVFINAWQISAIEEHNKVGIDKFYSDIFNLFAVFLIVITSILIIIIRPVIEIIISTSFISAWIYVPILFIASIFSSFSSFLGVHYGVIKNTKGALKSTVVAAILNLVLNLIFIPILGIQGAGLATLISMIVLFLIRAYDINK